jgi:hypothetical protein
MRGRGEGTYALAIQTLFKTTARRLGFQQDHGGEDHGGDG